MATVRNKADDSAVIDESLDNARFDIVPSDTVDLQVPIQALYVGTDGDVTMQTGNEDAVTVSLLAGGPYYVGGVTRILSTGTDATGLIGLASKGLR